MRADVIGRAAELAGETKGESRLKLVCPTLATSTRPWTLHSKVSLIEGIASGSRGGSGGGMRAGVRRDSN